MADLFALANLDRALTPRERKRLHATQPRGHAAVPGTGPVGETCGSCANLHHNRLARTYLKCGLMERYWTGGRATDVRGKDPACKRWEKR